MNPQIAALALHHPHHSANAAAQAFHTFGVWSHHGSGEHIFWLAIVVLVVLAVAAKVFGRKPASR